MKSSSDEEWMDTDSTSLEEIHLRQEMVKKTSMHLLLRGLHPQAPLRSEIELPQLDKYNLEKTVECIICKGSVMEAQILPIKTTDGSPCFHRFCKKCITRWLTPDLAPESATLEKKVKCPVCNAKANKRSLVPDTEYDAVLALLDKTSLKVWIFCSILFSVIVNPLFVTQQEKKSSNTLLDKIVEKRKDIGVRVSTVPCVNQDLLYQGKNPSVHTFKVPPETTVGYIAVSLLRERSDNLEVSDWSVNASPYTYPYLLTYRKKSKENEDYVPLPESETLENILYKYDHASVQTNTTSLDLYFAYKVCPEKVD